MIKINKINKYYNKGKSNEIHVIDDTSLELPEKGLVALLGKSGSGKTTLLNVIGGLDSYHSGLIEIDEKVINRYSARVWDSLRSKKIGYVFQNYYLIEDKTVFENLEISLKLAGLRDKEDIINRINYSLELVGLLKYKNRTPNTLSGGQQQRVGIARALVKGPSIIIADEPTGNLDSDNTFEIMDILKSISKNCLVVLVTHEEDIANFFADRIIKLVDGSIVQDYINESVDDLSVSDNKTIYLQDLPHKWDYDNDKFDINYTGDGDKKISIDLVEKDGKLYINAFKSSLPITVIDEKSEVRLADAKLTDKKKGEHKSIEINGNIIGPIQASKQKTSISNKESFVKAWKSYKGTSKKKRNRAALVIMFFMSVIITIILSTAGGYLFFDEDSYIKNKDLTVIQFTNNSLGLIDEIEDLEFIDSVVLSANIEHKPITNIPGLFDFGYYQTEAYKLSLLEQNDVIYGRMPENSNECVIDIKLAEDYAEKFLSITVEGPKFLIGEQIRTNPSTSQLKITGIVDGGYSGIWMDDELFDEAYENLSTSSLMVLTKDIEAIEEWAGGSIWNVENQYELEKSNFEYLRNSILTTLLVVILVSIGIMAFISMQTIKSSFINQVKEIGTLRCIGVSKGEVIRDFMFENLIRLSLSILAGIILTGVLLTSFEDVFRMIIGDIYVKLPLYLISFAILGGIFMALTYLNIASLLRKTPAEIMAKYDI